MSQTDQDLVGRLHKYATDWRVRAADSKIPLEAASRLSSLSAEVERLQRIVTFITYEHPDIMRSAVDRAALSPSEGKAGEGSS